jgi:hypothetical protein
VTAKSAFALSAAAAIFNSFLKSLLRFSVIRLEERILPEKQRDAPDACERHERIYDPRDYRSLAAAYPRDDIEFEQAYAAPVERADYY